jgi:hypothetical protein
MKDNMSNKPSQTNELEQKIVKDLQLEKLDTNTQNAIVEMFLQSYQSRAQLEMLGRLSDEHQKQFAAIDNPVEQDAYMEKAVGGDMESFLEGVYKQVLEVQRTSKATAKSLKNQ